MRAFAAAVADRTKHLDVLINNGAAYIEADDLADVSDDEIESVMTAGGTGTVLLAKHLLPLLRVSSRPDIVNKISACGEAGHRRSGAHPAFYAAKHSQAGLAEILSHRLRPDDPGDLTLFAGLRAGGPRQANSDLTARSVIDCILFAVGNHETASFASSTSSRYDVHTPERPPCQAARAQSRIPTDAQALETVSA